MSTLPLKADIYFECPVFAALASENTHYRK
jgi:hypothetical protein